MNRKLFLILGFIISVSFLTSCNNNSASVSVLNTEDTIIVYNRHLAMAVLYQQSAAETKALYYQAYNLATLMLDKELGNKSFNGKRAVVVDVDETILDNSPFEAAMITRNAKFPDDWSKWTEMAKAKALPGSVDFLNYAADKGVEVFYITNRSLNERDATIKNLIAEKFPMADTNHVITKTDESSKVKRRNKLMETHKIVLLIGDNLTDFDGIFDKASVENRAKSVEDLKNEFGKKFIVLPNPMYGDWENALYNYNKKLEPIDKIKIRKSNLKDF